MALPTVRVVSCDYPALPLVVPGVAPFAHRQRGSSLFADTLVPPSLAHLVPEAVSSIAASLVQYSHSAQRSALIGPSGWVTFANLHGLLPLPASMHGIILWLVAISQPRGAVVASTARSYLSYVASDHGERQHPWLDHYQRKIVSQLLTGKERLQGVTPQSDCVIITPATVVAFCSTPAIAHKDRVFQACSAVLSERGRRGGEIWPSNQKAKRLLRWKHIIDTPSGTDIFFPQTKTSQAGSLRLHYPHIHGNPGCAHCLLRVLKRKSPFPTEPQDLVFQLVRQRPLSLQSMEQLTRSALRSLGLPSEGTIGSKAWRRGLVTACIDANIAPASIMQLGYWKSDAYLSYGVRTDADIAPTLSIVLASQPRTRQPSRRAKGL